LSNCRCFVQAKKIVRIIFCMEMYSEPIHYSM